VIDFGKLIPVIFLELYPAPEAESRTGEAIVAIHAQKRGISTAIGAKKQLRFGNLFF
jgi:hypothetical protein